MPDLATFATYAPYHIISYGTLLGSGFFQSFIGGVVAFKVLPRSAFATLQTAIFPIYFAMQTAIPPVLALTFPGMPNALGHKVTGLSGFLAAENRWSAFLPLTTAFATAAVNLVWLGPLTKSIMRERKHQETRDGKKSYDPAPHSAEMQRLNKKFGQVHGVSALINLVGLLALVVYGGTLADMINARRL